MPAMLTYAFRYAFLAKACYISSQHRMAEPGNKYHVAFEHAFAVAPVFILIFLFQFTNTSPLFGYTVHSDAGSLKLSGSPYT